MASRAVIPRFLLPLQSPLWRGVQIPLSQNVHIRFASTEPPQKKPIVLAKPTRFNPPSHGSRLRRNTTPKHYGPALTASEVAVQEQKDYPGLMAPKGTWAHWFWHSRIFHTFITLGTLFAMAIYTFFMNYVYNSPYRDAVPSFSDLWRHPSSFFSAWQDVIIMHEQAKAAKAREHRTRHLDDVVKRQYYMKVHGIEPKNPVAMVFSRGEDRTEEELEAAVLGKTDLTKEAQPQEKPAQRKKLFGIL